VDKKAPEKPAYGNQQHGQQQGGAVTKHFEPEKIPPRYQINRASYELGNKRLRRVHGNQAYKADRVLKAVTF
jgi:hypothetical protein